MAVTDALTHYKKRHSTVKGADGLYLDDELDKISTSIKNLNDTVVALSTGIPLTSIAFQATGTFLGNISGSPASPVALTATQVTAALDVFAVTLKGLVPAPGTSTGKFLRDDSTWAVVSLSGLLVNTNNLSDVSNVTTARTNLGISTVGHTGAYSDLTGSPTLGTAAALNVGTAVNNVVQMATGPKLPAVDGSALTNMTQCQPAISSSAFPVGAVALCFNSTGGPIFNGSTVGGSALQLAVGSPINASPSTDGVVVQQMQGSGSALSGTWKNISGTTINSTSGVQVGYFVRTV